MHLMLPEKSYEKVGVLQNLVRKKIDQMEKQAPDPKPHILTTLQIKHDNMNLKLQSTLNFQRITYGLRLTKSISPKIKH